jgi:hypothetical protein
LIRRFGGETHAVHGRIHRRAAGADPDQTQQVAARHRKIGIFPMHRIPLLFEWSAERNGDAWDSDIRHAP